MRVLNLVGLSNADKGDKQPVYTFEPTASSTPFLASGSPNEAHNLLKTGALLLYVFSYTQQNYVDIMLYPSGGQGYDQEKRSV